MKWFLTPILLSILVSGCTHPLVPLHPPDKPFHSDGCSCFPDMDYGDCCVDHDRAYWQGGTPDQRQVADDVLRQCIAAKGRPVMAHLVYYGVRIGGHGWLPTPWRWGFGYTWPRGYWAQPPSRPEKN